MKIISKYGLIGENLDIKKNVTLEINNEGKICSISHDNIKSGLNLIPNKQNHLILPGFINSHTHIGDSFAKEQGFNKNLIDVVAPPKGIKHRLLQTTAKKIKIRGIKNTISEMISNGITFFIDFRENGIEGINLLREALKGTSVFYLVLGRFLDYNDIESVYNEADGIGFASYKNLSLDMIEKLRYLKKVKDKIIACHDAEVVRDETLLDKLLKDNLVNMVIHGTQYIKEDLEKIKRKNLSLVLCPRCNGYFGVGFPPINEIMDLKIPISLGTDNAMANNSDLFEEMRYLYRIYRVLNENKIECNLTAKDLLQMVTINAAKNFGIQDEFGSISVGKFANFLIIDLNDPNFYSYHLDFDQVYSLIVQRTKSENIKQTLIGGEIVFERN